VWTAFSIWPLPLLCRSFLVSCSSISLSLSCWAIWVLFRKLLLLPISSKVFPGSFLH
jgi:hypothetical protein